MIDDDVKQEFRNVDERLGRVEQILPTLATKADLRQERRELDTVIATLATKEDLHQQRRDLEAVIATLATKEDLHLQRRELDAVIATLATKEDLKAYATKQDLTGFEERIRGHFDVVAESLHDEIRLGLEGNIASTSRLETLEYRHNRLERRVTALEGPVPRRKK